MLKVGSRFGATTEWNPDGGVWEGPGKLGVLETDIDRAVFEVRNGRGEERSGPFTVSMEYWDTSERSNVPSCLGKYAKSVTSSFNHASAGLT